MGCSDSRQVPEIYDHEGRPLPSRKCIILLTPPSFETSKFIEGFPPSLKYKYISVGKLIRDEINKKTHYSKIIMDNLAKYKKINDKILQVLLKNTALQGNFIIQFCPKDNDDLDIWRQFVKQVDVEMVLVLRTDVKHEVSQQKTIYDKKLKEFNRDRGNLLEIFSKEAIKEMLYDEEIYDNILYEMQKRQKKRQE